MDVEKFIAEKVALIRKTVGQGKTINALSGGVDSSVVTALGHRAVSDQLETVFLDDGLMREKEPETVGYEFFKLRDEPLGYAVYEQFFNEEAEEAHLNTPHFARIAPDLIECLDGTYVREYLDPLE